MGTVRIAAAFLAAVLVAVAVGTWETGEAQVIEARWSLYERAEATSFEPGGTPIDAPGSGAGYEIVSFAAEGPSTALDTYMYAGPDLPPEHGGPLPSVVSCTSEFTATEISLLVEGAYPFAGCVFFVGVANTGTEALRVHLGMLGDHSTVTCNAPGCAGSDIEMLAGGRDASTAVGGCVLDGEAADLEGDVLGLAPGSVLVCPLYIVVLQPAAEGATYSIVVEPPPPVTTSTSNVATFNPGPLQPPGGAGATSTDPVDEATPTPTPTPTVTPNDAVEGVRTPGADATPAPPDTGSGTLIQRETESQTAWVGVMALVAALVIVALTWLKPR